MMYYGMLVGASVMFGTQFLFTQMFRKSYKGNSIDATSVSGFGGAVFGLVSMFLVNGFCFEYSHFAMVMAVIQTISGLLFTFCSMKALGKINLSLYSIFSMLGGMALPFAVGIIFFEEPFTWTKGVGLCLIILSFLFTLKKDMNHSGGTEKIYYIGVFIFNGMSGVLSKIYYAAPYERISAAGYSILTALLSAGAYLGMLLYRKPNLKLLNAKAIVGIFGSGVLNKVANWLLLVALVYVPASAQYPFITGGTMITSTCLACLTKDKPGRRELWAVWIALVGVIVLIM